MKYTNPIEGDIYKEQGDLSGGSGAKASNRRHQNRRPQLTRYNMRPSIADAGLQEKPIMYAA